jgi:hypothetical protein
MPQSIFERGSNEKIPAKFFGADASPERAARMEVFANNNPQVQQLGLRNWLLRRFQTNPDYKKKTFFEIYLSLLKMFNYGLAAANANKPNPTDDGGDVNMGMVDLDDDDDIHGGGRKKKKGTKKKKRRRSLKRSRNKIKRKKKSRKYKKKTKKTKKKKYK